MKIPPQMVQWIWLRGMSPNDDDNIGRDDIVRAFACFTMSGICEPNDRAGFSVWVFIGSYTAWDDIRMRDWTNANSNRKSDKKTVKFVSNSSMFHIPLWGILFLSGQVNIVQANGNTAIPKITTWSFPQWLGLHIITSNVAILSSSTQRVSVTLPHFLH